MKFYASDLFEVDKNSKTKTLPNHICTLIFLILDLHMYTYFSACLSWVELYHARNQDFFMAGDVCWDKDTSITISLQQAQERPHRKHFRNVFLLNTHKTTFQMKNFTYRWTQSGNSSPQNKGIFP